MWNCKDFSGVTVEVIVKPTVELTSEMNALCLCLQLEKLECVQAEVGSIEERLRQAKAGQSHEPCQRRFDKNCDYS